jgi:hypothetical protein
LKVYPGFQSCRHVGLLFNNILQEWKINNIPQNPLPRHTSSPVKSSYFTPKRQNSQTENVLLLTSTKFTKKDY